MQQNTRSALPIGNEDKLIKLAVNGNEQAFSEIVLMYQDAVYNMAMYISKNSEDAFDISQEVFLKLWQTLPAFRGESKLKTYLLQLTKNAAYDFIRKNSSKSALSLTVENNDGEEVQYDIADPSPDSNPAEAYLREEKIKAVRRAIQSLGDEHRDVIIMRDIEGMSYSDIARILHISEGTVKSRLNRGRHLLKKILENGNFF